MRISLISGSNRKNSQSERISNIIRDECIKELGVSPETINLSDEDIPLWKEDGLGDYSDRWSAVSRILRLSEGYIFVVPEWHGMAPPQLKNFILIAGHELFFHKPALIVAISSAFGGAYPAMELRGSSQKNSHICWIPEQVIIRNVKEWNPEKKDEVYERLILSLKTLIIYAEEMSSIRERLSKIKMFDFGM